MIPATPTPHRPPCPPPPTPRLTIWTPLRLFFSFFWVCLAKVLVLVLKTFRDTRGFWSGLCCPLCLAPAEFISHCFLCTGIYDVTANISFVLRWRISQGSCPYGVKQTANMHRLWLRSWGWVDIMVAMREHLIQQQKNEYLLGHLLSHMFSLHPW